jgi:hypothetical protein
MAGVVLHGRAVGKSGEVVADGPTDALLFDTKNGPLGDEMRVGVVKFEEALQHLAGSLIDLLDPGVVVEVFR